MCAQASDSGNRTRAALGANDGARVEALRRSASGPYPKTWPGACPAALGPNPETFRSAFSDGASLPGRRAVDDLVKAMAASGMSKSQVSRL
jgi:hypothetical protein